MITLVKNFQNQVKKDKIYIKCISSNGTLVKGITEAKHLRFVLEKPPGYKIFCEPGTIQEKNEQICFEYCKLLAAT